MRNRSLIVYGTIITSFLLLTACATPSSIAFKSAEKLETEGKFEDAMYGYADAFKSDPTFNESRIRFLKTRQQAAELHYKLGVSLAEQGKHGEAVTEFKSAQGLDPTQDRFRQQIEVSTRFRDAQAAFREGSVFEKGNKFKDAHRQYIKASELFPDNTEYQTALARIVQLRKSKLEGYELRLKSSKPITLKFKDSKIKDVFAILTKLSGVNFIFDDAIKDTPVSIYLENASFQQTLDLLCTMNKLSTKNLNETSVLLFQNSTDKSKQYDEMVLRTFHLNYMDAKKAINLIRTMIQVRKVYVNEDSNSIVVRDTEDVVDVVEKILDANDMPEAEVVLDVEVMEVSDKNAENIGLLLSNYNTQVGLFSGTNLMATSLTSASTVIPSGSTVSTTSTVGPSNLVQAFSSKGVGGFITVPNASFNFGKTLANGEVLSNPKIRVKNKEKAKFNVGTRVPITTTTLNGTVSQVNVQYVDVGVKVNAEPTIQLNNEILIKLNLEVSSILTKEKVGSDGLTTVVTIGTRNLETVLSLKDNETSVIGGLIQRTNSNDKAKIYLLSDIPLIGPLFTNSNTSKDKTELMLAITPRLVRGVPVPLPGLSRFSSGKEERPSIARPLSILDQDATSTEEEPVSKSADGREVSKTIQSNRVDNAAVTDKQAAPRKSLLQISLPASVSPSQQFDVQIKISDISSLGSASFALMFDPTLVEFVSMKEGSFLKNDTTASSFNALPEPLGGMVKVTVQRSATGNPLSGGGVLAVGTFRAKNLGGAQFAFQKAAFTSQDGAPLAVIPFSTAVDIRK